MSVAKQHNYCRTDYMIDTVLTMLRDNGDQKASVVTNKLRNDSREVREAVIKQIVSSGYVELYSVHGEGKRGRVPMMVKLTSKGLSRIQGKPVYHPVQRNSLWSL